MFFGEDTATSSPQFCDDYVVSSTDEFFGEVSALCLLLRRRTRRLTDFG